MTTGNDNQDVYTVATAAQLLGAKPPSRREADDVYFARLMKAADRTNKDHAGWTRARNGSKVRFAADGGEAGGNGGLEDRHNNNNNDNSNCVDGRRSDNVVLPHSPQASHPENLRELKKKATRTTHNDHSPTRRQDPVSKAGKIDTHNTHRPVRNNAHERQDDSQHLSDTIYFSPIDVNQSQISLSDPIDVAAVAVVDDPNLTPTQERYLNSQRKKLERPRRPPPSSTTDRRHATESWRLSAEQLDRLVKSLAESPLLQVHVRKQWWDDIADDGSVVSEPLTPSLSSSSGSPRSSSQESGTLYSQVNVPFLTEQRSPSVVQASLEEVFARDFPDHPKSKKAPTSLAGLKFGGIALTDPKVHGSPIRYLSKDYRLGAKVLQVGACSFMNIPFGTSVQSSLRIEPPSTVSANCRVLLQVVNQVLERKTGKKTYLLVAEVDVTESFARAALAELAAVANMSPRDIDIVHSPSETNISVEEQIDWCAIADELEISSAITDTIASAASTFPALTAESCTMQTLTLMSELERIKTQHQDFLVFRPTGYHDNGHPSGVHIPWTSQHLDQKLYDVDVDAGARGQASALARRLREQLMGAVTERFATAVPFDSRIVWDGQIRMIQAVPLLEGAADGSSRPAAWVCFLSGEYCRLLS